MEYGYKSDSKVQIILAIVKNLDENLYSILTHHYIFDHLYLLAILLKRAKIRND